MFWIIMGAFATLMAIAIVIYLLPSDPAKPKKKEKKERAQLLPDPVKPAQDKDWKAIAERWEKNNNALLGDVEKFKMQEKNTAKELEELKAKQKDLMDKLSLEKSWREKEQVNLDKARTHEKDLKGQAIRTEKELEREHSERLRIEREHQELKIKHESSVEEKRVLSVKAASQETTLKALEKELKELKAANAKLKEKREDVQWVAKSEHDALKKELERLKANGA